MKSSLVETIIESLDKSPNDWILSEELLTHKSGIRIWWSMHKGDEKPKRGNMLIESTDTDSKVPSRFINEIEYRDLWPAIMRSEASKKLKDDLMLKQFLLK